MLTADNFHQLYEIKHINASTNHSHLCGSANGYKIDRGKRINKSCTRTARGLGRDGALNPVSIVQADCFQYLIPITGIPTPGIPYDW